MWIEIELTLLGLSLLCLAITAYISIKNSVPEGYQEIESLVVQNNTSVLRLLTLGISGIQIIILGYLVTLKHNYYILLGIWLLVLCLTNTIYKIPYQGGLYGMFLCILLLGSGMCVSFRTNMSELQVASLILTGLLWILIGSWNHEQIDKVSQEYTCSVFSQMCFGWLNPIINAGAVKHLEWEDLYDLLNEDSTQAVLKLYRSMPADWSIKKRVAKVIIPYTSLQHILAVIYTLFSLGGPIYIFKLISFLEETKSDRYQLWPFVAGFLEPQMVSAGSRAGTRMRALFLQLIYDKALTRILSSSGINSSMGQVVTLMTVDTEMFRRFLQNAYIAFIQIPLSLVIAIVALFYVLGPSSMVAIAIVLFLFPITGYLGKKISKTQKKVLKRSGARVSLVNELILGIRIIKYLAWESFFEEKITMARKKEMKSIIRLFMIQIGFSIVGEGSGVFISFFTKDAGSSNSFYFPEFVKIVSDSLRRLPNQIKLYLNYRISIDRIIAYLEEEDREPVPQTETNTLIGFENVHVGYHGAASGGESNAFEFRDLTSSFPPNKMTLLCGPTGSGKSTILLGLLGELQIRYGNIRFPNIACAYSSQSAWIMNATIKDNILFGNEYDEERYLQVLQICSLLPDLQSIPGGDMTEIGEKGINLSGGQKQRVSLARACYSKCPVVILDDPISAVDASTAQYLLHHVLLGYLKGRTIIITSHAAHLIAPYADKIVYIDQGRLVFDGDYESFKDAFMNEEIDSNRNDDIEKPDLHEEDRYSSTQTESRLIAQESKAVGSVDWSVYKYYFYKSGGIKFLLILLSGFMLQSIARVANDWWLKHWTDSNSAQQDIQNSSTYFVVVYVMFGFGVILASSFQMVSYIIGSWWASFALHHDLTLSLLRAPMRFFETTPTGRILNRFAKDMESVDREVMDSVQDFFGQLIQGTTILCIIATANPLFLFAVPFIASIYAYISNLYLKSSRELKRFESLCRSPVYALFSETISGIPTIRAYQAQERFTKLMMTKINDNHKARILWFSTNRWLSLRTELLSAFVVFCAGLIIIFSDVSPGWAALTITYALDFTNALSKAIRAHADVELAMNSVERVQEYNDILQETQDGDDVDIDWPKSGQIVVKNLEVQYSSDSPAVLSGVEFQINPGEKLAVCGKSGAGKSTLSLAFFRIIEIPENSIFIDGVDISKVKLSSLRSRLSIIPQEPVLFSGTIRSNIDPLHQATDSDIWDAIKRVHFLETFKQDSISLDMPVDEGGTNFSHGQRQLLCLARSYIFRKRIVFLDEATASVDHETDSIIQATIRKEFEKNTVLCIAHRISTIIDYDKVFILDKGQVVEFGRPLDLLEKGGYFKTLCEETGDYQNLYQLAQKHATHSL